MEGGLLQNSESTLICHPVFGPRRDGKAHMYALATNIMSLDRYGVTVERVFQKGYSASLQSRV